MSLAVLSVASEAYPLIKTGGLADVVGALPGALAQHDVKITTLLPAYPAVMHARVKGKGKLVHAYTDLLGVKARLVRYEVDGLDLILLDAPDLFHRDGGPYTDPNGQDWPDNWRRFSALGRAAADLAAGIAPGLSFDLVHAHDWQAAMAPAYMRFAGGKAAAIPSVVTIHNLAFQGRFGREIFPLLGLPDSAWSIDGIEYFGGIGLLKAGLQSAGAITTVSPTYAEEIRRPEFGMGLEGLINARHGVVSGIVNGIDTEVWSPAADPDLAAHYTASTSNRRSANRAAVEAAFGLDVSDGPLFCVVSRLTWQKGMDVLADLADTLVAMGAKLALLGSGDPALEAAFMAAASRHPGRIGVCIGYDEKLSHLMQGGCDAILIPSRFEPCGLTQLYGLRYGCVPVVARTGGLADTVIDANEAALAAGVATGFQFDTVTHASVEQALKRAVNAFAQPSQWRSLQKQGMKADFSWARSGLRYAELYRNLTRTGS
jgi:starch synthase